tara:strand:+ start:536 stop:943 length:408 start_codon:yes stop_codon:yes gene_type:complete
MHDPAAQSSINAVMGKRMGVVGARCEVHGDGCDHKIALRQARLKQGTPVRSVAPKQTLTMLFAKISLPKGARNGLRRGHDTASVKHSHFWIRLSGLVSGAFALSAPLLELLKPYRTACPTRRPWREPPQSCGFGS